MQKELGYHNIGINTDHHYSLTKTKTLSGTNNCCFACSSTLTNKYNIVLPGFTADSPPSIFVFARPLSRIEIKLKPTNVRRSHTWYTCFGVFRI